MSESIRYHLTDQALDDIDQIWLYSLEIWGRRQADEYINKLLDFIDTLSRQPQIYRDRTEHHPPVRIARFKSHSVIFRVIGGRSSIIRIIHGRQDLDVLLGE